jgi:hypothetical protein
MPDQGSSSGLGVNWALASAGASATSAFSRLGYSPLVVNDGDRSGATTGWWVGGPFPASNCSYVDGNYQYVRINFNGAHPINEMDIFQVQDSARTDPPTPGMTDSMYGLAVYHLQYCPAGATCTDGARGTGWVEPSGGYVYAAKQNGANHVWNKLTFPSASATAVRVLIECGYAAIPYLVELEAWDTSATGVNVAAAANGSTAQATSVYSSTYPPSAVIDGDRTGWNWGYPAQGSGWADGTPGTYPDVLAVTFPGAKTISQINLFGVQDNYQSPGVPTSAQTWTKFGLSSFQLQYCPAGTACSAFGAVPGTGWVDVPGSPVTNNNHVWSAFSFAPVSATEIRVVVTSGGGGLSRITELEAWDYSNAPRTFSPDPATATELRRQMLGETCWSFFTAALSGEAGWYKKCSWNYITWSAKAGAWSFATPSYISSRYLGGFNLQSFPGVPTADMNNLGWPTGPYVGSDASGSYVEFERGIMAAPGGTNAPRVIGGVLNDSVWGGPDRSSTVNQLLTSAWLGAAFPNKYPASDTMQLSLGITAPPDSTCGFNSPFGNRGFMFTTLPDATGSSTTLTLQDGASNTHVVVGSDQKLWTGTIASDCPTATKLGWPISDEAQYDTSSTHQEFQGGTIMSGPGCDGTNGPRIVLDNHGPMLASKAWQTACAKPVAQICTNSDLQTSTLSNYTYYWHCRGIERNGPGATVVLDSESAGYTGITLHSSACPGGNDYVSDDPTYSVWLAAGGDGTVDQALLRNPPAPNCGPWAYDTTESPAGFIPFKYSCPARANCAPGTAVTYFVTYTALDGVTNTIPYPSTVPDQLGTPQSIPGLANARNCVYGAIGYPPINTETYCQYLHADSVARQPHRLRLTVGINANGGSNDDALPVFVRLQDGIGAGATSAAPTGNFTWLDLPDHPFQNGKVSSFDLSTANIGDIDDITGIILGSTGAPLCIDSLTLSVDDDGPFNDGGDGPSPTGAPGSAYRVAYSKSFLNDLGHCVTTGNVDFDNYTAPGTALAQVGFNSLRNSADWQYQHIYWLDVHNAFSGTNVARHFNGYPDYNSVKALLYEKLFDRANFHGRGIHFTADRPMQLSLIDSSSDAQKYVQPVANTLINPPNAPDKGTQDVLGVDVFVDNGPTVKVHADVQLVTLCDAGGNVVQTQAIAENGYAKVVSWWAGLPIVNLVMMAVDAVISNDVAQDIKGLSIDLGGGAGPLHLSFAPQYNGADGTTDTHLWPGIGLSGAQRYCTCYQGIDCPVPAWKMTSAGQ